MNTFIKITRFIINLITSIIIILGSLLVILFIAGIQPFVVESGSMEPAIKTGSVCFIDKRQQFSNMQVGDIIAFKLSSGASVTHRVAEINDDGTITTKGDANANVDNVVVTPDNFLGKNVFSVPEAGIVVKFIQTTRGKIVFGTLILVFLVAGIMLGEPGKKKAKKEKDDNKKENENKD